MVSMGRGSGQHVEGEWSACGGGVVSKCRPRTTTAKTITCNRQVLCSASTLHVTFDCCSKATNKFISEDVATSLRTLPLINQLSPFVHKSCAPKHQTAELTVHVRRTSRINDTAKAIIN